MGKLFRYLLDVVGLPGDIETVGKWLAALLGVSTLSAWLVGFAQGLGWAIFVFMGVLAFGTAAFGRLKEMHDDNQMQYKLIPRDLSMEAVGIDPAGQLIADLRAGLENHAKFPLWYDVEDFQFEINNKPIISGIDSKPQVIPPQSGASGCKPRMLTGEAKNNRRGHLKVLHKFGRSKRQMNMRLFVDYEFELTPAFSNGDHVATGFA
jgi:hypothetical protein